MIILAVIITIILLIVSGMGAYTELTSKKKRMDETIEFMGKKNVGSVNGIPVEYMFTAIFIITLLAIIGGLMKG